MPDDVAALEKLGIEDFDDTIFEMSYYKLRKHFSFKSGGLHTSRLIRNLIWQDRGYLVSGELEPFYGNLRSYWYSRVKPVLARAKARKYAKKYDMMIDQFVRLVVDYHLMAYADFGFTDEGTHNRSLGQANRHIFCVAEKIGHLPLLEELQGDYDITIVALGGQPSALSSEYFLADLQKAGFTLDNAVPLFTIVDYDPAGDIIAKNVIYQLTALGFEGELTRIDLALPSRMTHDQIKLNKFTLSKRKSERKKNKKWAAATGGLTDYGFGLFYGLEADALSWQQLTQAFAQEVLPYLEVPKDQIVRRRLKAELIDVLKDLLLAKLGLG